MLLARYGRSRNFGGKRSTLGFPSGFGPGTNAHYAAPLMPYSIMGGWWGVEKRKPAFAIEHANLHQRSLGLIPPKTIDKQKVKRGAGGRFACRSKNWFCCFPFFLKYITARRSACFVTLFHIYIPSRCGFFSLPPLSVSSCSTICHLLRFPPRSSTFSLIVWGTCTLITVLQTAFWELRLCQTCQLLHKFFSWSGWRSLRQVKLLSGFYFFYQGGSLLLNFFPLLSSSLHDSNDKLIGFNHGIESYSFPLACCRCSNQRIFWQCKLLRTTPWQIPISCGMFVSPKFNE